MAQTARYALPLLDAGQAQKEITHNGALAAIDALLQLAVASRTIAVPPTDAVSGSWIVPAAPSGSWAGQQGSIAVLDARGWSFITPRDGCIAFIADEQAFICSSGGMWQDAWPIRSLAIAGKSVLTGAPVAVTAPAGGTVIDVEGRAAIAQLIAALRLQGILADG